MDEKDRNRELENAEEKRGKPGFLRRWGFYIAVTAAVVAAGIISYTAVEGMLGSELYQNEGIPEGQTQSEPSKPPLEPQIQTDELQPAPEDTPQPPPAAESETQPVAETPSEETKPEPSKPAQSGLSDVPFISQYVLPVTGELSAEFSGDKLKYNATTGDWRTHNGIDLKADEGANVVAVAGGRVLSVGEDELWGRVISIKLDSGYTVVYAGLGSVADLDPGELISQGDTVGTVGNSSVIERGDGPHLHLEVLLGDKHIDPLTLIQ